MEQVQELEILHYGLLKKRLEGIAANLVPLIWKLANVIDVACIQLGCGFHGTFLNISEVSPDKNSIKLGKMQTTN